VQNFLPAVNDGDPAEAVVTSMARELGDLVFLRGNRWNQHLRDFWPNEDESRLLDACFSV
jgi:hypothetical protein